MASVFIAAAHIPEKQYKHGGKYSYKNVSNEYITTKFHEKER